VLSKIRYYTHHADGELARARAAIDPSPALSRLPPGNWRVQPASGGTLGAGFFVDAPGINLFLKTHAMPEGRETLYKEFSLLSALYEKSLRVGMLEVGTGKDARAWMVTDRLMPATTDMDPTSIVTLINSYSHALSRAVDLPIPRDDNFSFLLQEGKRALSRLVRGNLLGAEIQKFSRDALDLLDQESARFSPHLCHGDLGPKNLMTDGDAIFSIDWEDAFWGIEGYDYLYWLTFFQNRKYYSSDAIGRTQWGPEIEIAVMVLILLLKSDLSVSAKTDIHNTLSIDQRIAEIARFGSMSAGKI
jgi:thiamine kinase-like enzyme